jgi:dTDP-4-dehydrorhamnose 3,5-epimerase
MNYKDSNWQTVDTAYLKTFGKEVPVYSPAVYREYRGEIFTTYHSVDHPANRLIPEHSRVHTRFSKSYTNVLRGLHYDDKTWKLVQALVGDIYLVVLDVRPDSDTFGKWESYIISEKTRDQVMVPPGFANGHYALTDCIFHYSLFYQGDYVNENNQGVIKWNDPAYNIEWPTKDPIIQGRDK